MVVSVRGSVGGSTRRRGRTGRVRNWRSKTERTHLTLLFAFSGWARHSRVFIPAIVEEDVDGTQVSKVKLVRYVSAEDPDHERERRFDAGAWRPEIDPWWKWLTWLLHGNHRIDGKNTVWSVENPDPRGKDTARTLIEITGQLKSSTWWRESLLPSSQYIFAVIDLDNPQDGIVTMEEFEYVGEELTAFYDRQIEAGRNIFEKPIPVQLTNDPRKKTDKLSIDIAEREVPDDVLEIYRTGRRPNLAREEIPTDPDKIEEIMRAHIDFADKLPEKAWEFFFADREKIKALIERRKEEAKKFDGSESSEQYGWDRPKPAEEKKAEPAKAEPEKKKAEPRQSGGLLAGATLIPPEPEPEKAKTHAEDCVCGATIEFEEGTPEVVCSECDRKYDLRAMWENLKNKASKPDEEPPPESDDEGTGDLFDAAPELDENDVTEL